MTRERREDKYREEAERLALLPVEEQRQAIARIQALANDPQAANGKRVEAREHAAILQWLLQRLSRTTTG